MSNFRSARDLKEDILFRGFEPVNGGSQWDENDSKRIITYLNRVYRSLASGASEFLPEYVDDWWWMRARGLLYLLPVIQDSTVTVTKGSSTILFGSDPTSYLDRLVLDIDTIGPSISVMDIIGWRFRIDGHPDLFVISDFSQTSLEATLDMPFTGDTNTAATYTLMKDTYDLDDGVSSILGPMVAYRQNVIIQGMSPERMDQLYPLSNLRPGIPSAFCLENDRQVRFDAGGREDGFAMRLEYRYRPTVEVLTDHPDSVPLVPLQYRHILADMALVYLLIDKNDDRAAAANAASRSGLAAMFKENRRRFAQMDRDAGMIYPRGRSARPLMTESGLVIPRW
jgi:hypothetical protein